MALQTTDRTTRRNRILGLLVSARGEWVALPKILEVGGAQFGARLYEIRHQLGFNVQNRKERHGGQTHSWYRLTSGGAPAASLFDMTRTHVDLG